MEAIAGSLEVGTKIVVMMARYDASKGAVIPWHIIGKIAAPVNREGHAGTIPGVRLTDAVCDDPAHDCTTHAIALTTVVRVVSLVDSANGFIIRDGDIVCDCGNDPTWKGFEMCDDEGKKVADDDPDWMFQYVCNNCGSVHAPDFTTGA